MKSVFGGPVRGHIQVELLSAYLDQQATPAERAYIDAHLQQCAQCQTELDSLRRTVLLLQALPRVAVPRAFTLSETQVGIRHPAASPGWLGGLVRGLGAVAAIMVVAFVAFTVLRPDNATWNPAQTVALAPSAAPAARAAETQQVFAPAPAEPQAQTQTEAPGAATEMQSTEASAPTAVPGPSQPALMAAAPPTEASAEPDPAAVAALPVPTGTTEAPLLAKAAPTTPITGTDSAIAAAAAAAAPDAGAALGRGGGGPSEPIGIPPAYLTPEATPPGRALADALPSGVRLAYSDLNALWAIDQDGNVRQLVQGRDINTPQLSPSQEWVIYRTYTDQGLQVWAIAWEGGKPKLLLDDATLPTDALPDGYTRRAISDTRWAPEGDTLAVTLSLIPDPQKTQLVKTELWEVDVVSGAVKRTGELGRSWRPYYSPDGKSYLVLQYGTDEAPEGTLSLVDTNSGASRAILTFHASPGKPGYDNQVAWAPDGKMAWVAIPTADYGAPDSPNGTKLYRVAANGAVKELGEIDAAQVNWSPTGAAMAYTRYIDNTLTTNELYVANADGSQAQLYAPMTQGEFISWSPQGTRFLYQDNFQVFAGAAGELPTRLANATSMMTSRWVSDTQILAAHDTGSGWMLTLRDVGGDAASLLPLSRDTMWDVRSN